MASNTIKESTPCATGHLDTLLTNEVENFGIQDQVRAPQSTSILRNILQHLREKYPKTIKYVQFALILIMLAIVVFTALGTHISPHLSQSNDNQSLAFQKSIALLQSVYTVLGAVVGVPVSLRIADNAGAVASYSAGSSVNIINSQLERILNLLVQCNITSPASCFP